ncbi:hypothetical protein [Pedobacter mucosus]|uniref:hypothetical protein n=1 Tax=Pedobacter mucosus TaxID=2895286 RepID=UPI001EE3DC60|nr:hypothetical protein [Pedobacter mucosus]UKT64393.1 hypothetical protein LOK61_01135 [Pedobacter mucosus]
MDSNTDIKLKSFFTYASGERYFALAFALARSYRFHNGTAIQFTIISNQDFTLPWDLKWVGKLVFPPTSLGSGLEFKLHLLEIAPTVNSIFIDADTLIYGNITSIFSLFKPETPNVIGLKVTEGTFVDEDVQSVCTEFSINYMVRFCGALYYLIKNRKSAEVFAYAKALYKSERLFQHNDFTMYDEPILSIALAKFGIEPLLDDGNIWGDLVQLDYQVQLNIFNAPPVFFNDKTSANYKFWLPPGEYKPILLHVGSGNYNKKPWLFDSLRLKLHYKFLLPVYMSDLLVKMLVIPAYQIARKLLR